MSYKNGIRPTTPFIERLEASIGRTPFGCWIWLRGLRKGYGYFAFDAGKKKRSAHRASYEHFKGPIPKGMQIDHLCGIKCCVNPEHLEVVTRSENVKRAWQPAMESKRIKTHCPNGHLYSLENLVPGQLKRGKRSCLICDREKAHIRIRKRKERLAHAEGST